MRICIRSRLLFWIFICEIFDTSCEDYLMLRKIMCWLKQKKYDLVPDGNGNFWYKDDEGVVYQILRTPYKEIPIVIINWKDKIK